MSLRDTSMNSKVKIGASIASRPGSDSGDTSQEILKGSQYRKQHESSRQYVSWNKEMDSYLAKVLIDQMAQGNKCDGDTWKPQALQAAVTYLNSALHLTLTKDNIKNRLKAWKKYYCVVTDVQTQQSGFSWEKDRKMIVITSDEYSAWTEYVKSHPDAKGLQNKMIENWNDIILLCGKDRATGQGAETFEESVEAMEEEGEPAVNSSYKSLGRPSSSMDSVLNHKKRAKKDALVEVVSIIATSFQEFVASKKKEERPTGIEIHEVVSSIGELTSVEVFMAVQKLMNGDVEQFKLLKALPNEKKREWIQLLINS